MHFPSIVYSLNAIGAIYGSYASPVSPRSSYAIKEYHTVPKHWSKVGPARKSDVITLQFGLKQGNEGVIEQHLLKVSNPSHANYGQHLTAEEVNNIIAPSRETENLVEDWLLDNDITDLNYNPAGDWSVVWQAVASLFGILQLCFGTVVFSSLLYIGIGDATILLVRYAGSALVCRFIMYLEIESMVMVAKGKRGEV